MHYNEPVVTALDAARLSRLLGRSPAARGPRSPQCAFPELDDKLETAAIVESRKVGADVVTMNSTVSLRELDHPGVAEVTLVYPADATSPMRVSVLSPLGQALLGTRVGAGIELTLPGGEHRRYEVEALIYQPEAAGHYDV